MSVDGQFCPEIEFAPVTPEGIHVAALLDRPGIWIRAGLGGVITGMDIGQARAALPSGIDNDFSVRLLVVGEGAFLDARLRMQDGGKEGE